MAPTLLHGDIVVFRRGAIRQGMIVLAHDRGVDIVKRVRSIDASVAYLEGDNKSARHNTSVETNKILGRLVWPVGH